MRATYTAKPQKIINTQGLPIHVFPTDGENIDQAVVEGFGEEWLKFKDYSAADIAVLGDLYFDIINDENINKSSYCLDIGCGTGRWSKYLSDKVGFIEAVDPSNAVIAAAHLLKDNNNIRISKASVETIPFADETFDFAMSIGVLHHIPDTQKAMLDCVKKVKKGGYFYCYLYYNLDNKGPLYRGLFHASNIVRYGVSRMPTPLKKITCDVLAVGLYMPFVLASNIFKKIGLKKLAKKTPLYDYHDKSFFVIRNDSLDRFGTRLEHRYSREQVITMMENCGLSNIVVSPKSPYYHAVGKKLK